MGYFTDCDFDSTLDMVDAVNEVVERHVRGLELVSAAQLGLDVRCGRVFLNRADEVIVVECSRSIDYYGGFEYIREGEGRTTCGSYTFFNTESSRVQDCFDHLNEADSESDGQPDEAQEWESFDPDC
jgi:hypothetical protein